MFSLNVTSLRTGFVLEPAGPVPFRARPRRGEAEAHRQRDGGHPGHLSLQVGGEHVFQPAEE